MSNPWKRDWSGRDDEGNKITLDGARIAQIARALWHWFEVIAAVARPDPDPERSALRLRHGARAACKRLREERYEARQHFAEERETALEIRDEQRAAERERDAARLELRALEWLALHGYPVGRDPDGGRVMAVYREADLEPDWHPSWESAARALGWEG